MKEFKDTSVVRQNILNNKYALNEVYKAVGIQCVLFEGQYTLIKKQVADFYGVTERTIDNCLDKYNAELIKNGYETLKGKRLIDFKLLLTNEFGDEMDFVTKTTVLGIFSFKAFLNIAMLLTDSDRAQQLRTAMLDIVIDTINKRTGGNTKYINQRDEDYINNMLRGEDYRKEFTNALRDYVDMGKFKYLVYTDKIYKSIFKENANEYRKILSLQKTDSVRDTMYSEILDIISSYEIGFAEILQNRYKEIGRKLSTYEVDSLFKDFENQKLWKPLREKARMKMASRDLCFREALHKNLEEYITSVPESDFERFLGEKSLELDQRLEEYRDALKRLKERD